MKYSLKLITIISLVMPMVTYAGKLEKTKKAAEEAYQQVLENGSATAIQSVWRGTEARKRIEEIKSLLEERRDIHSKIQIETQRIQDENPALKGGCSICIEGFKVGDVAAKLTHKKCLHSSHGIFHSQCITQWTSQKPTCPLDRNPITTFENILVSSDEAKRLLNRLDEVKKELKQKISPAPLALAGSGVGSREEGVLRGYSFIPLPPVTEEDVRHLSRAGVQTSIKAPIPSFKIADAVTSIGLYHAVMGHYLNLDGLMIPQRKAEILRNWEANPDLPLTYTTLAEDQAFVNELNRQTGRRFSIPNEKQVEYAIRGRLDGNITTTKYHFGNSYEEVNNRAFIATNPLTQGRPHGVHEIPEGQEAQYKNSFGLIHPIGNVFQRSSEGVVRGGAFDYGGWNAESSFRCGGYAEYRRDNFGFRLAED